MKAYLFDLDDTLINTLETKIEAIRHTSRKYYDMDIAPERIRTLWGKPFPALMRELYPAHVPIATVIENYVRERDAFPSPAFAGTVETLKKLKETHILGIVTSHAKQYTASDLAKAGIPVEYFSIIQAAEDSPFHKPDPRVFDPALAYLGQMGISRSETVYVGDSILDYDAATGAGISFVAIADRTAPAHEFEKRGASVIQDIRELIKR